ncbi:flagellar filament capping protein FliD [Paenibacillus sp. GCM10027626]|uniref:flagellar filament capping protein FliD n=1 Tax=Paenibacillus sp. GCM10027626 TaxID=3273411 RepID=UPI0036414DC6
MRISGFASGLDIDAMVKELMIAKRAPLNKLNQQKKTLEWQREQYRDINIKLIDFRNNKLSNYGLSGSLSAKQVNVTGNSGAVSAKATGSATSGNMTVEVTELATASTVKSTTGIGAVDTSKTLGELKQLGKINFDLDTDNKIVININGTDLKFNESDTLASVVTTINSSTSANVFFDYATGGMSMTSKESGLDNSLNFSGKLIESFVKMSDVVAGKDAQVAINGISTTRSSNTFTENGIEITLNGKTNGTAATLNVTSNTDKIVDNIKSFIKDYNELLDSLNSKLGEERFRKYAPLTDDQRKEMKEDEIKLWEDKAKSGLLRNDIALSTLATNIRLSSMTSVKVGGTGIDLSSLGIETGEWGERGKLVLKNEDKLRAAIEANPEQVMKFFTQQSTETDASKKNTPTDPEAGLFNRLSKAVMTAIEGLAEKAGTPKFSMDEKATFAPTSLIGKNLRDIDLRISTEAARMKMLETSYYKKFTAMEKAINRFNSQSSSLFGATQ